MTRTDATYPVTIKTAGDAAGDPSLRDHLPRCRVYDAREVVTGLSFAEDVRPWDGLELDAEEVDRPWGPPASFATYVDARGAERSSQHISPCGAEHGTLIEEVTTLCFARSHAFSSTHVSIGAAQHVDASALPSFCERLRFWPGGDLAERQTGHHRDRDKAAAASSKGRAGWTGAVHVDDRWLRADGVVVDPGHVRGARAEVLVPFVDRDEP